jgi:cation-transporting ATPase 13A1
VTIFSRYMLFSIILQCVVHVLSFNIVSSLIPHPAPSSKFEPSLMNSVLFILSCTGSVSIFLTNYIGKPFREDIHENPGISVCIAGLVFVISNAFLKLQPDFNSILQLVSINEYVIPTLLLIGGKIVLGLAIERLCFHFFLLR